MYGIKELQKIARKILITACENLIRDGHLQPISLVFGPEGLTHTIPFEFNSIDEKRAIQQIFRHFLREIHADAAVVVTESWMKMATDGPLDLTRPVFEMPGHQEAIVVEAASAHGSVMIIQVFQGP